MKVHYITSKNQLIRSFAVEDYDFSCDKDCLFVDINMNMVNNKLEFQPYSYGSNRNLIEDVFNNVGFLKTIPAESRDRSAKYPETTTCKNE